MTKKLTRTEVFYYKLKNDFQWYAENFLKIRDKSAKIVPFKLNKAQKIVDAIIETDIKNGKLPRYLVLKARQMGLSTYFEGKIFHKATTTDNMNAMIMAHEEMASTNLFNMSKLFFDYIPDVIKPMKKYANGKVLSFENPTNDDSEKIGNPGLRSKISIATAGSAEVGRSSTTHLLHASEVAFYPDAKTTMLGLMQSVPDQMNTLVVWETTANGVGDFFHEQWQKATRGENEFTPIFLPWFIQDEYTRPFRSAAEKKQYLDEISIKIRDHSGREINTYEYDLMTKNSLALEQLNWRKWAIENKCQGDEDKFMQEYPATAEEAFVSSGRPKFNIRSLRKYQTVTKPGKTGYLEMVNGKAVFVEDKKGYITIWEEPVYDDFYVVGGDVAEGLARGDYSCGIVLHPTTLDIVAMWHGHIDPDLFGLELIKLATYYNQAYIGVENNNHGLSTLNSIRRAEYWNIYFSKQYDRVADTMTQKIGWTTNIRTKPLMIDKLTEFIREMYIGIYSDLIVSEMFTYVIEDDGKTNAQTGCHDDTVMALAIALQLALEGRGEDYQPEIPFDQTKKRQKEVVDKLFESNVSQEYT